MTLLLITCATHIRDAKFLVRACPWITLPSPWHTSPLVVYILNGGSPTCLWKDTAWLSGNVNGLEGFSCRAFRDVYGEKDLTSISPWYDMSQHHLLNLLECLSPVWVKWYFWKHHKCSVNNFAWKYSHLHMYIIVCMFLQSSNTDYVHALNVALRLFYI